MSIDKSDVKIGAAHEIGCRLDDVLDGATKDMYRLEGAQTALQQAVKSIENFMKVVDKDLDDDKTDLETAKTIKTYIQKVHKAMTNLLAQSETNKLTQTGKVQAMQKAVEVTKKFKDEELAKAQNLRAAYVRMKEQLEAREKDSTEAAGDVLEEKVARPVGMRPGLSIKERRKLEAAAAKSEEVSEEKEEKTEETLESPEENQVKHKNVEEGISPDDNEDSKPKVKRQKK
jgi:hypothetical protein